jgi:L,D-transpeptidase catalytic domain
VRVRVLIAGLVSVGVLAGVALGEYLARAPEPVLRDVSLGVPSAGGAQLIGSWKVAPPKVATSFLVADAVGPKVPLYASPDRPLAGGRVMDNPTWEGLPVVFLVKELRKDWAYVQVSSRPNEMKAWVRMSDIGLRQVPNWVRIEIGAKRVTVFHGAAPIFQTTVATGRASAPTPTGHYFVDGFVRLANPNGPYGAGQVSVSAFSNVYSSFGGGSGQIAMHGTNSPALLGQGVSHGCVRMDNDSILRVADLAPLGTPVEILA